MSSKATAPVRGDTAIPRHDSADTLAKRPSRTSYFVRNRFAGVGLLVLVIMVLIALTAQWIAPHGYDDQNLANRAMAPFWGENGSLTHPLGTDQLGRDILSRILHGTRVSLGLAASSVVIAAVIGIALGLISGFYGGKLDAIIMRITDVQLSLPYLLFAIAVIALLGTGITNLMIVMVLYSWAAYARLIRVTTMALKEREFVLAARSVGATDSRMLVHHVAPNVIASAIILTSYKFAELIIFEASLSFLGLGVQPPMPSWGGMLGSGREYFTVAWWLATFPGLVIMVTVLGANMLGDTLRDFFDPRMRNL